MEGFTGTLAERHQHFFDAFGRYGYITDNASLNGETLAEVMQIAAQQNHWYLELMVGLGGGSAGTLASWLMSPTETWTEQYLLAKRSELVADAGFQPIIETAKADAQSRVEQARAFLGCDAGSPPPACGVDVRFIIQGSRTRTREYVFTFRQGDLFEADIRPATVVTLYLLPSVNEQLRPKLLRDLRPGTRIVSHAFDMEGWKPQQVIEVAGGRRIYLWVVPERPSPAP